MVMVNNRKASLNFTGKSDKLGSETGVELASSIIFALAAVTESGSIVTEIIALNSEVGLEGGIKAPGVTFKKVGNITVFMAFSQAVAKLVIPAKGSVVGRIVCNSVAKEASLKVNTKPPGGGEAKPKLRGSGSIPLPSEAPVTETLSATQAAKAGAQELSETFGRAFKVVRHILRASIISCL